MDMKKIEQVIKLASKYGLQKFEIEDGDFKLKIAHPTMQQPGAFAPQPYMPAMAPVAAAQVSPEVPAAPKATKAAKGKEIKSPFVGTFYRSPAPGSDVFVEVGQRVKKGDTLCIIEAMKLMNEIEADHDGVIVEILVANEEPVEFEQALFLID